MKAVNYSTARDNLAKMMDTVCENHEPLIVTRQGKSAVVMVSLEDYEAMEETAYLLRSPKNARRLMESIAQLERGQGTEREIHDE